MCNQLQLYGTNINYELTKTFSVENFSMIPETVQPIWSSCLQNHSKNFTREIPSWNSSEQMETLQFLGAIKRYAITPQATVTSTDPNLPDRAGQMRLTIAIEVEYLNMVNEEENLKQTFSFFRDYDPRTTSILQVESQLIEEILKILYRTYLQPPWPIGKND
jgi:hypothetical protein